MDCISHPVAPPKIVAIATDTYLTARHAHHDKRIPVKGIWFGEDIEFGVGRSMPAHCLRSVGSNVAELKDKMSKLLGQFATNDTSGMAARLFTLFLAKQSEVLCFEDKDLNAAASAHSNIKVWCARALGAANDSLPEPGKKRIHQALKKAGWDLSKIVAPADLGVPAFNLGYKALGTEDFGNGLGVMINGVQHAFVLATHYHYDKKTGKYCISLEHIFYDVFGLDDEDLLEYGYHGRNWLGTAAEGISAWWQLQHQYNFAPIITRTVVKRKYEVVAA